MTFLVPACGPVLSDAGVALAYADVGLASWPVALRSLQSHLIHLHETGVAERSAKRWRRGS